MEVVIRGFRPDDLEGLYELDRACYEPAFRLEYPRLRALLADPQVAVVVAEVAQHDPDEQGLIAGLLVKREKDGAPEAAQLGIVSLMVHPNFRRAGLGRRLLDWAVRLGRADGAARIVAPLERENSAGAAFLALGFSSGPGDAFFAGEEDGALWQRALGDGQAESLGGAAQSAAGEPAAPPVAAEAPPGKRKRRRRKRKHRAG
jgi:ribosomal protein S18 acetylase RimI-like enzyme